MLKRLTLVMVLAIVGLPATGAAAIAGAHWVSPAGSDSGPGTLAQPWLTLQFAVDQADPGDVITVLPGTYAGMRIERSGTAGGWITLRASGTVVIDRPGPDNRHESNVELETWEGPGTVAYWIIEGFEVSDAPSWGIDTRGSEDAHSHHITVRDNRVHDNGIATGRTGIFFAFTDDVVVVGNESFGNGEHGIYLSNSGDRFEVRDNHLHHNANCGLHVNGDLSMGGDGIISDGVVASNLIVGNGTGGCAGINLDGAEDVRIRNNVIVENHATGIAVFQQDGAVCSREITIEHNTIVQAADGRWALVLGGPGCRDVTVVDNVLFTRHSWRGVIEMPTALLPGLVSHHNVVTGRFTVDGGDTVLDLGEWQAATGQDIGSTASTIALTIVAGGYRHRPDGPAQDSGAVTGATRDFDGIVRPANGAWDIGAFETPTCDGLLATIVGTTGRDVIVGTAGIDVIAGLDGSDVIRLAESDDVACGGRGHDRLFGGQGMDRLFGERGNDHLIGHEGADDGDGGPGYDECRSIETPAACEW